MKKIRRNVQTSWKKMLTIIALVSILFAFANIFVMNIAMAHDEMPDCPYPAHASAMCPMNVDKQISFWETLYRAEPKKFLLGTSLLTVVLFSVLLMLRALRWRLYERLKLTLVRLYGRSAPQSQLYILIKRLFAEGLLHPKIFDYSRV